MITPLNAKNPMCQKCHQRPTLTFSSLCEVCSYWLNVMLRTTRAQLPARHQLADEFGVTMDAIKNRLDKIRHIDRAVARTWGELG